MSKTIKQLTENSVEFYPMTAAEGVVFQDGNVLADKVICSASYDSTAKKIYFYNSKNVQTGYIDATAFIKDGMVNTVVVSNGNLVISFNTDAGKNDISIPISSIFNANNYYTKTQTDSLVNAVLPTVTSSDSGKILMVNSSGAWIAESISMQQYYTGTSAPANTLGKDGDLYLETS